MLTPRRLLAFLAVFLAVAAVYFLLDWREQRQEQAELAAKRLFQVKEAEIATVTLKKKDASIQLEKKGDAWQITRPISAPADKDAVPSLVAALAALNKDRDLGEEKDLQPYGLDRPGLVVEFTAGGEAHHLAVGHATPGQQGYYALADSKGRFLVIRSADKEALDRPLTALRDKTLFASAAAAKVTAVKIRLGVRQVDLAKDAPTTWKWLGREGIKVRADRVESLLRRLDLARIKDFVAESPGPKELAAFGLAKPLASVTIETEKGAETLLLGNPQQQNLYARKGTTGPVFLVEERFKHSLEQTLATLEDRRLWSGDLAQISKVTWGPPDGTWTAVKGEKTWKLTGPGQGGLNQPSWRLEMSLQRFQELEFSRLAPGTKPSQAKAYRLELWEATGQLLMRLMETGKREKDQMEVNLERQGKFELALVPIKAYQDLQADLARLTQEPEKTKEEKGL